MTRTVRRGATKTPKGKERKDPKVVYERVETGALLFAAVIQWVDRIPNVSLVQKRLTASTGRPRSQSWRTFFTLAALATRHQKQVYVTDMHAVAVGLTPSQRHSLGIKKTVTYHQLIDMFNALAAALEKNVLADPETGEVLTDPLTGEPLYDNKLGINVDEFVTSIVTAAIPDHIKPTMHAAVDSTDVETMCKRQSWSNQDPDVADDHLPPNPVEEKRRTINRPGWPKVSPITGRNQHTKDESASEGWRTRNNAPGDEVFVGYDLHLITDMASPDEPHATPFIRGMALRPAGTLKSGAGLAALRGYTACHGKPKHLIGDRGYSYLKPTNWANYLLDFGIPTTIDLHTKQRGVKPGPFPGTIWVDGGLFADSLPKSLRALPAFTIAMSQEKKDALIQQYEARRPYLFEDHGRPLPNRRQRVIGPAARKKVRCINTPASMRLSPAKAPRTTCRKGDPCSCGKALTLGAEHGTQMRQEHPFGTRKWAKSYNRRTSVERGNAMVKEHHGTIQRSTVRVIGEIKVALLLAFMVGCANFRCARNQGRGDAPAPDVAGVHAVDVPDEHDPSDDTGADPPTHTPTTSQSLPA